ncbi:hypothetical protein FJ365_02225 [Candidatus Dependentiae bacterium]|nr:hypothetical protein [Candidatus Dependentiae bacterium]
MNNVLRNGLLLAMLGMAPVSFCATAEEAMQAADKIDLEILRQAIDFSHANIIKKEADVFLAKKELEEAKRWLCKFQNDKRKVEARMFPSRLKAALKKMWHSYPYGLKHIVQAIASPLNLSLYAGSAIASVLCVYYKIPIFRWSTEPGTLADCAKLQAMLAAGGVAGGYLGTFIVAKN